MTAPSNANTSGLEVVAWRFKFAASNSWAYHPTSPDADWADDCREVTPLVTAASAQAAIDAEKARADRLTQIARLLDECIWFNPDTQNFEVNHDGSVEKARAALQQETQK